MVAAPASAKGPVLSKYQCKDMNLLKQSNCIVLDKVDDKAWGDETFGAMSKLGVDAKGVEETIRSGLGVPPRSVDGPPSVPRSPP